MDFGDDFKRERKELVSMAAGLIDADRRSFRLVGKALDAEFTEAVVRASQAEYERKSAHFAGPAPTAPPREGAFGRDTLTDARLLQEWMRLKLGDRLRASRLWHAICRDFGANHPGDFLRSLGSNLRAGEREANARRAILVTMAILDPDADQYLGEFMDIARAPWVGCDNPHKPVLGRAALCKVAGHDCLALLREAVAVLKPDPQPTFSSRNTLINAIRQAKTPAELLGYIEKLEKHRVDAKNVREFLKPEVVAHLPGTPGGVQDGVLALTVKRAWMTEARNELFRHAAVLRSHIAGLPVVPDPSQDAVADLAVRLRQWCVDARTVRPGPTAVGEVEAPTGADAKSADSQGRERGGPKKLAKKEVADKVRKHLSRAGWPGYANMGALLGCSGSWVHGAVKATPGLVAQVRAASKVSTGERGARSRLRDAKVEADPNAADPAEAAQAKDSDALLAELMEASAEHRVLVNSLTERARRKLADDLATRTPDERSALLDELVQSSVRERRPGRKLN